MSLRTRVLAGVGVVAVVLALAMVALNRTTRANLVRQVDAQLDAAVLPARGIDLRGAPGTPVPRRLSALYVGLVVGGRVETVSAPDLHGTDPPLPRIDADRAVAAAATAEPFTTGSDEAGFRYRVRAFTEPRTGRVVVLALPLEGVQDAVRDLLVVEVAATSAILVVLGLVAWWVVHLGVRPVKQMTVVATEIAAGDLSRRVPEADDRTEAGQLGGALNRMMGQIETAFEERARSEARLRQFVADASHELRTPVATIRGYAELHRTGGLTAPADLDDAMRRTEQEAVRMGQLVDDLLLLARLDQGRPLDRRPVDLATVVRDAGRDAGAVDPDRPIETVVGDEPLVVTGDDSRLRQVVANVIGNALVHTAPGTPIEVRAAREGAGAVVSVTDQGGGMPPEVAAHAFERFYRGDPARSRHQGGSGLGLAIVDATVRAHGGSVTLRSAPGAGTTVRIELPLSVA